MKKYLAILLTIAVVFSVSACGSTSESITARADFEGESFTFDPDGIMKNYMRDPGWEIKGCWSNGRTKYLVTPSGYDGLIIKSYDGQGRIVDYVDIDGSEGAAYLRACYTFDGQYCESKDDYYSGAYEYYEDGSIKCNFTETSDVTYEYDSNGNCTAEYWSECGTEWAIIDSYDSDNNLVEHELVDEEGSTTLYRIFSLDPYGYPETVSTVHVRDEEYEEVWYENEYDSNNRIMSRVKYIDGDIDSFAVLSYDEEGRITGYFQYDEMNGEPYDIDEAYLFGYDSDGRIERILQGAPYSGTSYYPGDISLIDTEGMTEFIFEHNSAGELVCIKGPKGRYRESFIDGCYDYYSLYEYPNDDEKQIFKVNDGVTLTVESINEKSYEDIPSEACEDEFGDWYEYIEVEIKIHNGSDETIKGEPLFSVSMLPYGGNSHSFRGSVYYPDGDDDIAKGKEKTAYLYFSYEPFEDMDDMNVIMCMEFSFCGSNEEFSSDRNYYDFKIFHRPYLSIATDRDQY